MRKSIFLFITVLIVSAFVYPAADAGIYKWTDKNGVTHYSDTPPPGEAADTGNIETTRGSPPGRSKKTSSGLDTHRLDAATVDSPAGIGGMFWKINRDGVDPSFLLGTIHSDDPRVMKQPVVVINAFKQADIFVMEALISPTAMMEMGPAMMFMDGTTLESVIGRSLFKKVDQAMSERGIPEAVTMKMKPWAAMSFLSMPENRSGTFLDMDLYNKAQAQGKKRVGLEKLSEQIAVFDGLSMKDQVILLKSALSELKNLPRLIETLIQKYVTDDLTGLIRVSAKSMDSVSDKALVMSVMERLNDNRNVKMARRLAPWLQKGNCFVAVGALHLTGANGLIKLLRAKGYTIESISRK